MFQPIQLLLIIFLAFAISRVYLQVKSGTLSLGEFFFWTGLFSMAVVGVLDPNFTNYIANQLGIGRGADVVIYFSIILLFYLIFRTHIHIEDTRHEITKLVRELALKDEKKPNKSKSDK